MPDLTLYSVLADFDRHGRAWVERDAETADRREELIGDILSGEIARPLAVHARNVAEGWARDVTADIAEDVVARALQSGEVVSTDLRDFIEQALGIRSTAGLRVADGSLYGQMVAAE